MKDITVDKTKLLTILKTNREAHNAIFNKALEGYRAKVIQKLSESIEQAKAPKGPINTYFDIVEPVDQTADYDRVIGMLHMDTEAKVELTERDYKSYVLDEWSWSNDFTTSNSHYTDV